MVANSVPYKYKNQQHREAYVIYPNATRKTFDTIDDLRSTGLLEDKETFKPYMHPYKVPTEFLVQFPEIIQN